MGYPEYNNDIITITRNPRNGEIEIDRRDRAVLLRVVADLQARIDAEMGAKHSGPLRFVIPLAMRFTEQAGRVDFRSPKGNNPYNIMGDGVDRPDNKEYVTDKSGQVQHKTVPATFQGYPTEADGVAAFFKALRTFHGGAWKPAWDAIRDVSSFEDFARGLRPKGKPWQHYLTAPVDVHISGLKGRAREVLKLLEIIYKDEAARLRQERYGDEVILPGLHGDPYLTAETKRRLDAARLGIANAEEILSRIKDTRTKLGL